VGEYPKCASCGNELGEGISRSSSSAGDVGSNPGSKEIIKSRILLPQCQTVKGKREGIIRVFIGELL
jgi:hypothetical protein